MQSDRSSSIKLASSRNNWSKEQYFQHRSIQHTPYRFRNHGTKLLPHVQLRKKAHLKDKLRLRNQEGGLDEGFGSKIYSKGGEVSLCDEGQDGFNEHQGSPTHQTLNDH